MATRTQIAFAVAYRQVTVLIKNPYLFLPPMLFPLMNFLAFAGFGPPFTMPLASLMSAVPSLG